MMNQFRTRKTIAAGEAGRPRLSKSSGDAAKNMTWIGAKGATEHLKPQQHHHSKTRIPKDIRYELEDALVGLCDVWFEDIKPYLLRNNIKLHVPCQGGAEGAEAAAGGDRGRMPPTAAGARNCSHVDPGAATDLQRRRNVNSAVFSSVLPTTLKMRSHRPPQQPCKVAQFLLPGTRSTSETRRISDYHNASRPSIVLSSTNASATLRPRRSYNPEVPVVSYTMKQSYFPGRSQHTREVLTPQQRQQFPDTDDQYTQTEKRRNKKRRSLKGLPAKAPEKDGNTTTLPAKRNYPSPEREKLKCSASTIRQRSPAHPSPSRQPRTSSPSPVRRMEARVTFTSPSGVRQTSPAYKKSVNAVSHNKIAGLYCDDPQFQDDIDSIFGASYDTYFMYEILKTEETAALNLKSHPSTKERVKALPPWK